MKSRVYLIVRYADSKKTTRRWYANFTIALAELCMLEDTDDVVEVKMEFDK